MSRLLHVEEGLTLIELMIVSALFMATLGIVSAVMWNAMRTTRTAEQESDALERARVALTRVERDIRGALSPPATLECDLPSAPEGYCLRMQAQLGDGSSDYIRYRMENVTIDGDTHTYLFRDVDCASDFSSCGGTETVLDILANRVLSPSVEAFDCTDQSTDPSIRGARVAMVFIVSPLQTISGPDGTLEVRTSAAARNLEQC